MRGQELVSKCQPFGPINESNNEQHMFHLPGRLNE
jgi:hypothetical protein